MPLKTSVDCQLEIAQMIGGTIEVELSDGSRADIMTGNSVHEIKWAREFYAGLGQVLHYSRMSQKLPVLWLLMYQPRDESLYQRAVLAGATLGVVVLPYRATGCTTISVES